MLTFSVSSASPQTQAYTNWDLSSLAQKALKDLLIEGSEGFCIMGSKEDLLPYLYRAGYDKRSLDKFIKEINVVFSDLKKRYDADRTDANHTWHAHDFMGYCEGRYTYPGFIEWMQEIR